MDEGAPSGVGGGSDSLATRPNGPRFTVTVVKLRSLVGRQGVDAIVLVIAAAAQIEVWVDPEQTPRLLTAPAALLWTLPLLLRERFPVAAPAVVFATLAAETLLPGEVVTSSQVNGLALLAAFAVAGAAPDSRRALTGALIGYAAVIAIVAIDRPPVGGTWPILVFGAVSWVIARTLVERGQRAATLEERADRLAREQEAAVAGERARIARELHDVIAHSVTVMTVQAGAARLLVRDDSHPARDALLSVENTGRQALADMRRLLGILRADGEPTDLAPQPGVANVDALAEQVRAAGMPVEVVVEGEPRTLPAGVDLAAYRVLQEALTNALKHAGAARAEVVIHYGPSELELSIVNDGRAARNGGRGHGLVGMRERVALYGGTFEAGPRDDGGYAVRATLPVDRPR